MAAATYTSDLTDIYMWESTTGVTSFGGGGSAASAGPDYAIEGTNAVAKPTSASERGFLYASGASFTIGTDDHFFAWILCSIPGLMATRNNRGLVMCIGDSTSNFVKFHLQGNDTLPFGGIQPYAVRFDNTTSANLRTLVGAPGTTPSDIGCGSNITGTARFDNTGIDATRIGTGYDILLGTGADPEADFAGIATDDDIAQEGILKLTNGGYNLQGKLRIGSGATACEFLDSNTNIFLVDTLHALSDFTELLVENAASIITLTNINFVALGTTNKGRLEVLTSAATLTFNNVGFIDFGATVLGSGSSLLDGRWIGADVVTANGANLSGSSLAGFEGAADTSSLVWNVATNPNGLLDNMTYTMGTVLTHAIEFGLTSPTTMTLTGINFSGYSSSNNVNNSALHIKRTTGTVDITISGGSGTVSYRSDGATVNIISGAVDVNVTATLKDGTAVDAARVYLKASDGTGPFPFEETVTSISRATTVATVVHTAHGMATNDKIIVQGITDKVADNYVVKQVTVTDANTYTFVTTDSGSVSYTGTIKVTFVALNGVTNVSGILTLSRVYTANQPVVGWTRKSTSSPYLQEGVLVGVVNSSTGFNGVAVMLTDE